jgi:hypothetical protein
MALSKRMGAIGTRKTKSFQNLCGGREKVLEKFSKDGSVFACMQRKDKRQWQNFGKENKSWSVSGSKRV